MRTVLSTMISNSASKDKDFLLLTGDHGYALFDKVRKNYPDQFVNVGIMEQALISISAGLSKVGIKPLCYGLASFVPIRVLEQIKFDVCLPELPVKIIGDGAGLIYTNLGNSHFCAEDIAVLMPLPLIEIFAPGDPEEMRVCYSEFINSNFPAYLRVGKCDNPVVNNSPLQSTKPYFTHTNPKNKTCFVSSGAMLGTVNKFANDFNISHLSIMKLKPIDKEILELLKNYNKIIFFEEHTRQGGVVSAVTELFIDNHAALPIIESFCLNSSFTKKAGSYQYALSEHGISIVQMRAKLGKMLS